MVKKHFNIVLLTTVAKVIYTSYWNGRFQAMEFASIFVYIAYLQATLIIHISIMSLCYCKSNEDLLSRYSNFTPKFRKIYSIVLLVPKLTTYSKKFKKQFTNTTKLRKRGLQEGGKGKK